MPKRVEPANEFDAVIVGAGFAGMYMLYRMRQLGYTSRVIEAGSDVGGTWYWNRYPGARCDIESLSYQYAFADEIQREWNWSERFAAQPELLRYAQFVADRFDLRRDMQFDTRVSGACYLEDTERWQVETSDGQMCVATYLIMGTGCLSVPRLPTYPGLETFAGDWYHTGEWPHEGVDFTGKRVAVVGTGSSGIQSIPLIAGQAADVTVFQRTPNFTIPAHNRPLTQPERDKNKEQFQELRREAEYFVPARAGGSSAIPSALAVTSDERASRYERFWAIGGLMFNGAFSDILTNIEANATAAAWVQGRIHEIVNDQDVAAKLSAQDFPLGTKRLCVDTGYYDTFNRENVHLVDIRESPIAEINAQGIRTASEQYSFDTIVFATGFDAMTGALLAMDIRGRDGMTLRQEWEHGPRTYLGLQVHGFPNLFTITGPLSPSVLSNMIMAIEQHVDFLAGLFEFGREREARTIEPTKDAQDAWVDHVRELGDRTLFPLANSWYMGANIPGKPRVFMPYVAGLGNYRRKCDEIAASGYSGFNVE